MADKIKLEIVTPEEKVYSDDVEYVELPGIEGDLGIYPNHIPLLTRIIPGQLKVRKNGYDFFLAVGDGFVEVTGRSVSILTDLAVNEADVDQKAVEDSIKRAQEAMSEKLSAEETAAIQASVAKSIAQTKIRRRRAQTQNKPPQ